MQTFFPLLLLNVKRLSKNFFILFYSVVFPLCIIALLGYLTSKSYGTTFTSYEYYSIVMIPFCLLMGITSVAYVASDEKRSKTAQRYISAPISKTSLISSKFFSLLVVFMVCNLIVLLVSYLFFHLPIQGNMVYLMTLLFCESVAISGIGLFLGLACKNFSTIQNFINFPIMLCAFLGGVFFPVRFDNYFLSLLVNISPLTWINKSILYCLYVAQTSILLWTSLLLLLVGLVFIFMTIKFFKKEAFV